MNTSFAAKSKLIFSKYFQKPITETIYMLVFFLSQYQKIKQFPKETLPKIFSLLQNKKLFVMSIHLKNSSLLTKVKIP